MLYFPTPDGGSITEPFSEGEEDYGSIVFGQRRRTVHDIQTVEAARGKFTLGERKETGLRYQTRTTATGIPDMPINRYEWVGSGFSHIIGGEVSERYKPTFGQTGSGLFAITGTVAESTGFEAQGESTIFAELFKTVRTPTTIPTILYPHHETQATSSWKIIPIQQKNNQWIRFIIPPSIFCKSEFLYRTTLRQFFVNNAGKEN